jgi:hypothetical protein
MTKTISLVIGLGLFSTLALAQSKQDPLEACYQQPDGAPRLVQSGNATPRGGDHLGRRTCRRERRSDFWRDGR